MKPPCKRHELAGMTDECFCPEPYKTPFALRHMVLTYDPMETPDLQPHIRPLLNALNSLNGLVRGEAFNMTIDDAGFDKNEVKLILEFETRKE